MLSPVHHDSDDPARQSVLEELQRLAIEMYGEDRGAEAPFQRALATAATAVWRVSQESFEPSGDEPLPTHD
jgi:hypothetical protein